MQNSLAPVMNGSDEFYFRKRRDPGVFLSSPPACALAHWETMHMCLERHVRQYMQPIPEYAWPAAASNLSNLCNHSWRVLLSSPASSLPPIIQFHACKVPLSCYSSQFQPVLLRLEPLFQQVPLDLLSCRLCNLATRRCTLNV
jgi:hypothetical protein